jgi:LacI family transcriptional regulator
MAITIQQIADRAGVSAGTVSRVLNGHYKENRPAIAQRANRIRQIALELGYRPNSAARSILTGRFGLVALVTCGDLGFDWLPLSLVHGIHSALEKRGLRLVVNELSGDRIARSDYVPSLFRESAVDAMLINVDSKLPRTIINYFQTQPLPGVMLNQRLGMRSVYPDEFEGGRLATEHLIRQGHKAISFLKLSVPEAEPHYSTFDRRDGFIQAMTSAGLSARRMRVGFPNYCDRRGNGIECVGEFLEEFPDVSAVVCYGIAEATALHVCVAREGRRVPDDLAIMVFHEREAHSSIGLPMDTLIIPFKEVGQEAVDLVSDVLEGNGADAPSRSVSYSMMYDSTQDLLREIDAPSDRDPS